MSSMREKTLSYRRAEWFEGAGINLERAIRDAHKKLVSIGDRTIIYGAHHVRSAKMKAITGGGVLLHFTAEIPGDPTSVVPRVSKRAAELDLRTANPPADGEWLSGDAFLFVKDDHVCMCMTDIHDAAIRRFLQALFEKANIRRDSTRFSLSKVADIGTLNLIHKEGVKELIIKATLYKATANYVRRKNRTAGVMGAVGKHLKAVLGKPNDVSKDNLRVELSIKTDKRLGRKHLDVGEREIEALATDVVKNMEDDDDFVILTLRNQKITPNEIFIRSKVWIESDGKTVNCEKAWEELLAFFIQLQDSGALEE